MRPLERYQALVQAGTLCADPAQQHAIELLQYVHHAMQQQQRQKRKIFGSAHIIPKGVYLWGGVGRGKSLLMDLFFNNTAVEKKRRVHFHAFMQETHKQIAQWRAMNDRQRKKQPFYQRRANLDDPIPHIAKAIFQKSHLLCFDELQVTDIADAMLLGRLFEHLFTLGCVVIATSNRHPKDLYKDGINRQLFLPFIKLLEERLTIHELRAEKDYRLGQLSGAPVYYTPLGPLTTQALNQSWEKMICGAQVRPIHFQVKGREVYFAQAARSMLRASFNELCARPLGAEDYLVIARSVSALFIDDIPRLSEENRNEAKRFVTLIDALYEHRTKLICSADAPPSELYVRGDGAFEFERTSSRLIEMQSMDYLATKRPSEIDAA